MPCPLGLLEVPFSGKLKNKYSEKVKKSKCLVHLVERLLEVDATEVPGLEDKSAPGTFNRQFTKVSDFSFS